MHAEAAKLIDPYFANVEQAKEFLGISRSHLYGLMDSGRLPFAKIGACRRLPWKSLKEFAESCLVGAQS